MFGFPNPMEGLIGERLKFQVMSDLHLEVGDQYHSFQIPVQAPFLILAGDIGRLQDYEKYLFFMTTVCSNFDAVFLVLGNHEFYGISRPDGIALARKLEDEERTFGKLKVLHRQRLDIKSVCILGCTLHSHIRPENHNNVGRRMKDFQRIHDWSVEQHNKEHEKDLDWLRSEIDVICAESAHTGQKKHIFVITYHAPIKQGTSHPSKEDNAWGDGFATDLIGVYDQLSRVMWWVFGHTHFTTQRFEQGIRLISNQRGYFPDVGRRPNRLRHGTWFARKERCFDPRRCVKVRI